MKGQDYAIFTVVLIAGMILGKQLAVLLRKQGMNILG